MSIRMEINILEIGKIIISKEMANSFLKQIREISKEIYIKDNFIKENFKVLGIIYIRSLVKLIQVELLFMFIYFLLIKLFFSKKHKVFGKMILGKEMVLLEIYKMEVLLNVGNGMMINLLNRSMKRIFVFHKIGKNTWI
jgi:hypothetical protein